MRNQNKINKNLRRKILVGSYLLPYKCPRCGRMREANSLACICALETQLPPINKNYSILH